MRDKEIFRTTPKSYLFCLRSPVISRRVQIEIKTQSMKLSSFGKNNIHVNKEMAMLARYLCALVRNNLRMKLDSTWSRSLDVEDGLFRTKDGCRCSWSAVQEVEERAVHAEADRRRSPTPWRLRTLGENEESDASGVLPSLRVQLRELGVVPRLRASSETAFGVLAGSERFAYGLQVLVFELRTSFDDESASGPWDVDVNSAGSRVASGHGVQKWRTRARFFFRQCWALPFVHPEVYITSKSVQRSRPVSRAAPVENQEVSWSSGLVFFTVLVKLIRSSSVLGCFCCVSRRAHLSSTVALPTRNWQSGEMCHAWTTAACTFTCQRDVSYVGTDFLAGCWRSVCYAVYHENLSPRCASPTGSSLRRTSLLPNSNTTCLVVTCLNSAATSVQRTSNATWDTTGSWGLRCLIRHFSSE